MSESQPSLVDTLRGRIIRGLNAGTLSPGDRLPSARELVAEFEVDHRPILAAYSDLEDEGLVEVRPRGGVYVSASRTPERSGAVSSSWLVETFTEAYVREIRAPDLPEIIRRAVDTLRLRAVVIAETSDQVAGIARELRDDFALAAEGLTLTEVADPSRLPAALRQADVVISLPTYGDRVEVIARSVDRPCVTVDVRPDLVAGEWAILLRQPVWAVVATPEFGDMLRNFFAHVKGIENLHVLVHGRDDLMTIPEGAPTYVTRRVRDEVGDLGIRGRVLPAARTISLDSARRIFEFMVTANLRAMSAVLDDREASPARAS